MGISCSFPKWLCLAINVIYIQHKTTNRQIARLDCFRESKPLCLFTHSVAKIKSMAVTQEMNTKKNMTFQKYCLKKLHWKTEKRSNPSPSKAMGTSLARLWRNTARQTAHSQITAGLKLQSETLRASSLDPPLEKSTLLCHLLQQTAVRRHLLVAFLH